MKSMSAHVLVTALLLTVTCCSHSQPGLLPLGYVDVKPGPTVTGVISIQGWAASENGISKVCLYVDRQSTSCTENVTGLRPDVAKVYPSITGAGTSGWSIQVDSSGLASGDHEFVVQATSKSTATRDIGSMFVHVAR